ncbi:hypothetical protein TUM3794_01740 [Shewanella colwelliana]|uniref:Uncharacterized protein n=1 Tax=Shewanella colwelliana TaxID=23 RepID=A0ABQ4NU48_SHECO|nr:DUF6508 domain-containing protein [Shewanella colwelliana]GIU34842.1 hypothetical protein TUM3794_01740 [Shewanella colwelliana]
MNGLSSVQMANINSQYRTKLTPGEHLVLAEHLYGFMEAMDHNGLLLAQLNWDEWYQHSYLVDRPDYIGDASFYECQLLLTAMARLEPFSPGVLNNMRRQGVLIAIVDRLTQLSYQVAV